MTFDMIFKVLSLGTSSGILFLFVVSLIVALLFWVTVGLCLLVSNLYALMPVGWDNQGKSAPKRWWEKHGDMVGYVVLGVPGISMGILGLWITFVGDPFPSWLPGRVPQEANPATNTRQH